MRALLLSCSLLLVAAPLALAQDTPEAPAPAEDADGQERAEEAGAAEPAEEAAPALDPRVSVSSESKLDGETLEQNMLQAFLWERLNHFRLRVDSAKPTGIKQMDAYIAKIAKWWEKEAPGAAAAKVKVEATQDVRYDASEFYGEGQAHNFHGKLSAQIKDADGEVTAKIEFPFAWGWGNSSGKTKNQAFEAYSKTVQTALALLILNQPAVRDRVPAERREALAKWSRKERDKLLATLDGSTDAIKRGELAKLLRALELGGK